MKPSLIAIGLGAALAAPALAQTEAAPARATQPAVCNSCHKPAAQTLRGYFESVAFKSTSIQLNLGNATEIVRFDPKTIRVKDAGEDKPAEHLRRMRKGHEAQIEVIDVDGVRTASAIVFKGPIRIASDKLVVYPEVERLVALGPVRGRYTLIDSRPLPRFQEGTIPTAINLPFPSFDKLLHRLPVAKDELLIFFCQGLTCMMSPSSLRRAEAMGYTQVKVYREGWPEWTKKHYGVIDPASVKEAFMDKGIPHVLIDARAVAEMQRTGFIPGAVSAPHEALAEVLATLPDRAMKAPIMVYDATGGADAVQTARSITAAGYENVLVVAGGVIGWMSAGYALDTGSPALKVAYAPKPRPGSLPAEEFRAIAANRPADTLILDVRGRDELKEGMIPGALNIPDEEVLGRLAEIPRDKRIVTHCSTGVRAEMAYHKLKEKGFAQVAFLNADVDFETDGKLVVTPK